MEARMQKKKQRERKTLNDKMIKALKPEAKRYVQMDKVVRKFGVMVTEKGAKSYVLVTRLPGVPNQQRLTIETIDRISLEDARELARQWLDKIRKGDDPRIDKQVIKEKSKAPRATDTIGPHALWIDAAETYLEEIVLKIDKKTGEPVMRSGKTVAVTIRKEFGGRLPVKQKDGTIRHKIVGPWKDRQCGDLKPVDVSAIIRAKQRTAESQARNMYAYIKPLFRWLVATGYILHSPCGDILPKDLKLRIARRDRFLDEQEMRTVYYGTQTLNVPVAQAYRLLFKYGLRLNKSARGKRSEIKLVNFREGPLAGRKLWVWTIPALRMKNKCKHDVPLDAQDLAMLRTNPRFDSGEDYYLFSTTRGKKPVTIGSKVKKKLGKVIKIEDWQNHDIRRTVRSHLSPMQIEEHVRELMISHKRKGITAVYDQYAYLQEKIAGFSLWKAKLAQIMRPQRVA